VRELADAELDWIGELVLNVPVKVPLIVTPVTKPWAEMVGRSVAVAARRRERECIMLVCEDAT
jgi:hypothetical protein